MLPLILASTSPYRKSLLEKLGVPFSVQSPLFDEEAHKQDNLIPMELAQKLAHGKATSLAHDKACVIGCDQLVHLNGQIFGKAQTKSKACEQLKTLSGKTHEIITAVSIVHPQKVIHFCNITKMQVKKLSSQQIETYVQLDNPTDCAGSYKIELHGIRLFEKIESTDFTAIQGLPLLQLSIELERLGYQL